MATVSDDLIWTILDKSFCSFKSTAKDQKICKHPMNIYQVCRMVFCPLANSRYATIIENKGRIFLCMKSAERSHMPDKMWEKIRLEDNFEAAMGTIDSHLKFWHKREIKRCKIRYMKIVDYLKRMRRIRSRVGPELTTFKKKNERRLDKREKRALGVAQIENKIQTELLERLRKGVYGDLYKFKELEPKDKSQESDEEDDELDGKTMYIGDYNDFDVISDNEDLEDIYDEYENFQHEDETETDKPKKRRHLEIEYERH